MEEYEPDLGHYIVITIQATHREGVNKSRYSDVEGRRGIGLVRTTRISR